MEFHETSQKFHGFSTLRKNISMEVHGILDIPWILAPSPKSMEFYGISKNPTPRIQVPWNSMEPKGFLELRMKIILYKILYIISFFVKFCTGQNCHAIMCVSMN